MPVVALVVDDSMVIRHMICRFLEDRGYAVEVASNGQEALEVATRQLPSLIITDMQMPGMTGLELYQHLSTSGKPIPTILITAYPDNGVRERALAAGVVGYLSKPFAEDDLLVCIRSALTHAGSGRR